MAKQDDLRDAFRALLIYIKREATWRDPRDATRVIDSLLETIDK